jgi:CheY-like chemotaxis protein
MLTCGGSLRAGAVGHRAPAGGAGWFPVAKKVLVVDDERDIAELARFKLTHEGFEVATANSGEAALEEVARTRPDVIVLDVMMPGMTGWEVASRLKADPETRDIPIIMLTALGIAEEPVPGFADIDDYCTKPFAPAALAKIVRKLAGKDD